MKPIQVIHATVPCTAPPSWAVWERWLLDAMNQAIEPYIARYTHDDGSLIWREVWTEGRDGVDDFYEAFYNWPLLYLLGGDDRLLTFAHRHWEAITRQLTELGSVYREYERGYDQFHQGESNLYFYFLCLADPTNPTLIARARRFAGFYTGNDPDAPNYDPERHIIRAPHNGSAGPRWGYQGEGAAYGWQPHMVQYGLPYHDLPDITQYDDLKDPQNAKRMGEAMESRMGRGDVATNLMATSLVANAFLLTQDECYRQWVITYTRAWAERARQNDGLLPDNVGLSGEVGEYMGGRWYGGLYGWTWPHGYYNLGAAAVVAGLNGLLLTGDPGWLEMARTLMDRILALGEYRDRDTLSMSLAHHWNMVLNESQQDSVFVVPYRYGDAGWFDYQPISAIYPVAVWNAAQSATDQARLDILRQHSATEWTRVIPFRNKEDAGHEEAWLCFLRGENPDYPETILRQSYGHVLRRLAQIRQDQADLAAINIHHWQEHNPVITEALVQLTLGGPSPIYNGGLLFCPVRYFDMTKRRPGLPPDVAALVTALSETGVTIHLVNLSLVATRQVLIQAGAFGEHHFISATYNRLTSDYPGKHGTYAATIETSMETVQIDSDVLQVELPPGTEIQLVLGMTRFAHTPHYSTRGLHDEPA